MKNMVRNLLGIRKQRRGLPTGAAPSIGASLIRGNLKMRVGEAVSQEMWDWLLLSGWRTNTVREDRREYVILPPNTLTTLLAADVNERERLHSQLIRSAKAKANTKK